ALPRGTAAAIEKVITQEWGHDLIGSWNSAHWVNHPRTVGATLARLLGTSPDEVVVADSTSVNIFKLLAGVLALPDIANDPKRTVIVSEYGNFPTDLYIAQGVNAMLGGRYTLRLVAHNELAQALDDRTAAVLITQVDYCTGYLHDMATINQSAKNAGTHVVWDLSHSAGAIPIHLNDDGAEFAVGCGYKYLNGGPGAPGYLYVSHDWQTLLSTPLSGWFGHKTPFQFEPSFSPANNISRFLCGTPSILATVALRCGIEAFDGVEMTAIRTKSLALTDLFWQLMDEHCGNFGFVCIAPVEHRSRGSQLSFAHNNAYEVMQAIIDRGLVGDFRQPNLLRFGFTPLYTRFVDCWDAVIVIRDVMTSGAWKAAKFKKRNTVT
ncbi:MAG: kynureninase, partial [Pseudomonadota bacterium]